MAAGDGVEPANAAGATRGCAVLVADFSDLLRGGVEQLRREWAFADAAAVCLVHADRPSEPSRTDARALQQAGDGAVGARHVGIGAVVQIEQGGMSTFEHDLAASGDCFVDQRLGLGDVRLQTFGVREVLVRNRISVRTGDAYGGQFVVLAVQDEAQLLAERRGIQEVADAQANAASLVHIGWADAAAGGAEAAFLARLLLRAVGRLVVGHDEMGGGADAQPGGVDLAGAQLVELGYQQARVYRHAWPDDAQRARVENARRNQVDGEPTLLVDHGVAGIRAAVAADHQVRFARQQVDDFAFALIPPVAADNRRNRHVLKPT